MTLASSFHNTVELKIQRLHPDAQIPTQANIGDAGLDLTASGETDFDQTNQVVTYHTGIAVEIPEGYVGLLFPRSSIYKMTLRQSNCVGVIDSGYRGEILVKYDLTTNRDCDKIYLKGDKIAQLVLIPVPAVIIQETHQLSESERGKGGFGSSDVARD